MLLFCLEGSGKHIFGVPLPMLGNTLVVLLFSPEFSEASLPGRIVHLAALLSVKLFSFCLASVFESRANENRATYVNRTAETVLQLPVFPSS